MNRSAISMLQILGWAGVLALQTWGATCATKILYQGADDEVGAMDEATRTWPEAPEFKANWGDQGNGMLPPYFRLSGSINSTKNWTGAMNFGTLPATMEGGSLSFQIKATNAAVNLTYWVSNGNGSSTKIHQSIAANTVTQASASIAELGISAGFSVERLWLQLDQVPAGQYSHVLFDNITLSCAGSTTSSTTGTEAEIVVGDTVDHLLDQVALYPLVQINPQLPARIVADSSSITSYAMPLHKGDSLGAIWNAMSPTGIVLWGDVSASLLAARSTPPIDPQTSITLWRENLFTLAQGALRDSLFANPRELYSQGFRAAMQSEFRVLPLLIADLDYDEAYCDTTPDCSTISLMPNRFVQIALPETEIPALTFAIVYDPYFVTTNHTALGSIQVSMAGKTQTLQPGDYMQLTIPSAETQIVTFRYTQGGKVFTNQIRVEVAE